MKISLPMYKFLSILIILCLIQNSIGAGICSDWEVYKDEKCFKLLDEFEINEKAIARCKTFGATLVSILSQEEQKFLVNYIFVTNSGLNAANNVWLGAKRDPINKTLFTWDDGNKFDYSNWDPTDDHGVNDTCVEMQYNKNTSKLGLWDDIMCGKRNQILCEKPQNWTLETLRHSFIELRKNFNDYSAASKQVEQNNVNSIQNLVSNPVPINFIYIQLPTQPEPKELWPKVTWEDVSATYAGLFFRVFGGTSEKFGTIQAEYSPRLASVESVQVAKAARAAKLDIPANGDLSAQIYVGSGPAAAAEVLDNHLKFKLSPGEVRPRNHAVKVWKRTK